jgi:hypothetical protein
VTTLDKTVFCYVKVSRRQIPFSCAEVWGINSTESFIFLPDFTVFYPTGHYVLPTGRVANYNVNKIKREERD